MYVFEGMGDERTIVTVGFYDGINELFLKISKFTETSMADILTKRF